MHLCSNYFRIFTRLFANWFCFSAFSNCSCSYFCFLLKSASLALVYVLYWFYSDFVLLWLMTPTMPLEVRLLVPIWTWFWVVLIKVYWFWWLSSFGFCWTLAINLSLSEINPLYIFLFLLVYDLSILDGLVLLTFTANGYFSDESPWS